MTFWKYYTGHKSSFLTKNVFFPLGSRVAYQIFSCIVQLLASLIMKKPLKSIFSRLFRALLTAKSLNFGEERHSQHLNQ